MMIKKRRIKMLTAFLCLASAVCGISVWISYNLLTVTHYRLESSKIKSPLRIVMLADLHDHEFGRENTFLVEKIGKQEPDLVIMDGDMLNEDSVNADICLHLIQKIHSSLPRVPVIFSMGNHELAYIEQGHQDFHKELSEVDAIVIDEAICSLNIGDNELLLGGIYKYAFETPMQGKEDNTAMLAYREKFNASVKNASAQNGSVKKDTFSIMCAHRPESFCCWDTADLWDTDLILSGHNHGGQVILPLAGGLYSNLEGFFPQYDYGQFYLGRSKDHPIIITRGLSSNRKRLPRFNNPPEITVIDLEPIS